MKTFYWSSWFVKKNNKCRKRDFFKENTLLKRVPRLPKKLSRLSRQILFIFLEIIVQFLWLLKICWQITALNLVSLSICLVYPWILCWNRKKNYSKRFTTYVSKHDAISSIRLCCALIFKGAKFQLLNAI